MFAPRFNRLFLGACLLFPTVGFLAGCENNDDKALATAQACINTATTSTVDACLTPITMQTSAGAYSIRCAADFIAQGFNTDRLTSAFSTANSGTTAPNASMLLAVATMTFNNTIAGHSADDALSNCQLSQADSYRRLAEFAKFATTMANPNHTTSALTTGTATTNIESNETPSIETDVGAQTLVLYQDFCVEKSPFSGSNICTSFAKVKDLGSDLQIGTAIMGYTTGQLSL